MSNTTLTDLNKNHIRPLLQLNDRLRNLSVAETDINVTSIVAVGDQSHGKTSVIEALSGVELPRGEGIQTRLPLVLKLRASGSDTGSDGEYATIKPQGEDERRIAIPDIAKEVKWCTTEIAGDVDVIDSALELTVYRKDADDLTLIDLPGMTRVPLQGQSKDIETIISRMYERYMRPKESILLNVVSCMVDFSTSKSIQMSRELDPSGDRTLLCISKVDQHKEAGLSDKITKTAFRDMELKENNVFCVRNRSQPDNDAGVTIVGARERECSFFRDVRYFTLPKSACGVAALSARLVTIQYNRIEETLPSIAKKVSNRVVELGGQIASFGKLLTNKEECNREFETALHDAMDELCFQASGHGHSSYSYPPTTQHVQMVELALSVSFVSVTRKVHGEKPWYKKVRISEMRATSKTSTAKDLSSGISVYAQTGLYHANTNSIELRLHCTLPHYIEACTMTWTANDLDSTGIRTKLVTTTHTFRASSYQGTDVALANERDRELSLEVQLDNIKFKETRLGRLKRAQHYLTDLTEGDNRRLLCSQLDTADADFTEEIVEYLSAELFLSDNMHELIKAEMDKWNGVEGLPGIIPSRIAVRIMRKLNMVLTSIVFEYIKVVSKLTTSTLLEKLISVYAKYPRLCAVIPTVVSEHTSRVLALTREKARDLLLLESQMMTRNHYFMDTVQSMRAQIQHSPTRQDDGSPGLNQQMPNCERSSDRAGEPELESTVTSRYIQHVRGMSNADQRIADVQIEIFSYYKVVRKRLVDYITMCARYYLVRAPIMHKEFASEFRSAILNQSGVCGNGFFAVMGATEQEQIQLNTLTTRLAAVKQAHQELKAAVENGFNIVL